MINQYFLTKYFTHFNIYDKIIKNIFGGDKHENIRQHSLDHFYGILERSFLYSCGNNFLHNDYRNSLWQTVLQTCKTCFHPVREKCIHKLLIPPDSKYYLDNLLRLGNGARIYIHGNYLVHNYSGYPLWQAMLQACTAQLCSFRRKCLKSL